MGRVAINSNLHLFASYWYLEINMWRWLLYDSLLLHGLLKWYIKFYVFKLFQQ